MNRATTKTAVLIVLVVFSLQGVAYCQEEQPKYSFGSTAGLFKLDERMIRYRSYGQPTDEEVKQGVERLEVLSENVFSCTTNLPVTVAAALGNFSERVITIKDNNNSWYDFVELKAKQLVPLQESEQWSGETMEVDGIEYKVLDVQSNTFTLEFVGCEDPSFYHEGRGLSTEETQLLPASGTDKTGITSLWTLRVVDPSSFEYGLYCFMLTFRFEDLAQQFPDLALENCDDKEILKGDDVEYYPIRLNIAEDLSSSIGEANLELNYAYQYYLAGRYEDSKAKFQDIASLKPTCTLADVGIALCFDKLGMYDESKQKWQEVVAELDAGTDSRMCNEEKQLLQEVTRSCLGYCLEQQENLDEAEAAYLECVELLKRPVYGSDYYISRFASDRYSALIHRILEVREKKAGP